MSAPDFITLYEYRCRECHETALIQKEKEPEFCPYCGEQDLDYAPGPKAPAHLYMKGFRLK